MLSAVLRIESPRSDIISAALRPETERELPRTRVSVRSDARSVTISFEASDSTSMRAALNSYLGCVRITEDI